jgi:hypothetical protein
LTRKDLPFSKSGEGGCATGLDRPEPLSYPRHRSQRDFASTLGGRSSWDFLKMKKLGEQQPLPIDRAWAHTQVPQQCRLRFPNSRDCSLFPEYLRLTIKLVGPIAVFLGRIEAKREGASIAVVRKAPDTTIPLLLQR